MLKVEVEAGEAGSTPGGWPASTALRPLRRRRAAARLAGRWSARRGKVAHLSTYGQRDLEAGAAGRARHAVAHLLDDEADHLGRGDDAVRGGRLRAEGPGQPVHPGVRRHAGLPRAARRCSPVTEPATEPMRIWHLLTHTAGLTYGFHARPPGRRACTGRPASSGARRRTLDLADVAATRGPGCRCCSSPAPSGTTRSSTDVLGRRGRGGLAASASTEFFAERDLRPARHDRHRLLGRRGRRRPAGRALRRRPGDRPGRAATTPWARRRSRQPTLPAGGGGLVSHRRRLPPLHPDAAARRRARRRAPARPPHRART